MAQQYVPTTWVANSPPGITAQRLNNIESGISLASAPVVTALPAAPVNGQECNLRVKDVSGNTIAMWHLVYCSDEPGSYKWVFTGGSALYSLVDASVSVSTAGWVDASGPFLILPLAGDYEVSIGGRSINDVGGGGTDITQSYTVGGATPIASDGNDLYTPSAQAAVQQSNTRVKTGIAAGTTIAERINRNGGNPGINARWLRAVPRRVG